jgi:hypothetical protein
MSVRTLPSAANETREQRIEAIMKELRPKVEETVRRMVERAVDVPEAEEFGAIDFEFRDAGQELANDGKPAWRAGKKGVRRMQRDVSVLPVCGEVSLLSAAASVDGAWGSEGGAGLLLLWPVQAEFYSL